jgi:hypothetical protein
MSSPDDSVISEYQDPMRSMAALPPESSVFEHELKMSVMCQLQTVQPSLGHVCGPDQSVDQKWPNAVSIEGD